MPPAPPSPTQLERDVLIGLIRRDAVPPRACTWHQVRVCKRPNSSLLQLSPAYSKASITYLDTIAAVGITGEDYLPRLLGKKNLIIHFITAGREWRRGGGEGGLARTGKARRAFPLAWRFGCRSRGICNYSRESDTWRSLRNPRSAGQAAPEAVGQNVAGTRLRSSVFRANPAEAPGREAKRGRRSQGRVWGGRGFSRLLIFFFFSCFLHLLFSQSLSVSPYPASASLFLSLLLYPPQISPYLPPYLPLPFPPPPLSLSKPSSPLFLSLTPLLSI